MAIDRNIAQEVKERLDIVEFINRYVPLKSTGKNYSGKCPFHNEKTPSFMVNPEIQRYKCYGCGKAGDIFNFLQEIETLEFPEALEKLAKEAGIEYKRGKANTYFLQLEDANDKAQEFYEASLSKSNTAKEYLKNRGFTAESVKRFGVGYAPSYNALYKHLSKYKFDKKILLNCGLFTSKNGQIRDKFVNRIMFPLRSSYGKIIGFSGRNLPGDDFGPKYLNSPETPIFRKRDNLFGFYLSKSSIKKKDLCILCEGQIDVISAYSKGVENIVAPLGTGLTEQQLENIKKYTNKLLFLFDKDNAGQQALERGFILANKYSFITYASNPEPYQDLDELIQNDPSLLEKKTSPSTEAYSYLLINFIKENESTDLEGTSHLISYHKRLTENVENRTFLKYYNSKFSELTGVETANTEQNEVKKSSNIKKAVIVSQAEVHDQEIYLLLLAIRSDNIMKLSKVNPKYIKSLEIKEIIRFISQSETRNVKQLLNSADITEDSKKLIEDLSMRLDTFPPSENPENELNSVYINIEIDYYREQLELSRLRLSRAEETKEEKEISDLADKVVKLTLKIKELNDKNSRL